MTNVAYLLFTFFACLIGFGLGLLLNFAWTRMRIASGRDSAAPVLDSADDSASWDSYTKWQADNNRAFAAQVASCGFAPIVFAGLAWSQRTDVVHTVCGTITQVAGQAYICM
jgi:hypothetical protein